MLEEVAAVRAKPSSGLRKCKQKASSMGENSGRGGKEQVIESH